MNDEPYRIRLRSPWEGSYQLLPDRSTARYHFRRRFGCPTGIDASQRISLVVEYEMASNFGESAREVAVALNGEDLLPLDMVSGKAQWDVTARLNPRNELVIEASCAAAVAAASVRDARVLEQGSAGLRDLPAWIRDVRLEIVTGVEGAKQASP